MISTIVFTLLAAHAAKIPMINDPYKHVWASDDGGIAGLVRFYLDVNNDKEPELFVAAKAQVNLGGGVFHVFRKNGKSYTYLGKLPYVRPEFIEVSYPGHNGYADLKTHIRQGANQNEVLTYAHDGKSYVLWKQTEVKNPADIKIKAAQVTTEDSGPMLTWTP